MPQKRKPRSSASMGKTILNLIMLLPTLYSLVSKIITLLGYEARLAGKNIIKIVLLAFLSAIILASTWLCLLALLGVYLVSFGLSYPTTIMIIIAVNLVSLFILLAIARAAEKNVLFRATRYQIRHAFHQLKEE